MYSSPERDSQSICREMWSGGDSDQIHSAGNEALEKIQTNIAPLRISGLARINKSTLDNDDKQELYEWMRGPWFNFHRKYWSLVANKAREGCEQKLINMSKEEIGSSRKQIEVGCVENASDVIILVFSNEVREKGNIARGYL